MNTKDTIKWYKVTCSFCDEPIGMKLQKDVIEFLIRFVGFDYTITLQNTKEIDTNYIYEHKEFVKNPNKNN